MARVAAPTAWLIGLDAASALLTLGVAAFFLRVYLATRTSLHLLFALGLALVGATFATTTASRFDLGGDPGLYDHIRIAGQLGGALVVLFAYAGARARGSPRPWVAIGLAAAALSVFFGLLLVALKLPTRREDFAVAHAVMALAWAAAAWMAARGSFSLVASRRGLVPAAFALFALSKYTWFVVEAGRADDAMALLVYPWRFAAIALLLAALVVAPRAKEARDAPA